MSWDNSGSNNLSSWDLFETRRLDYAKGKKGGPRNATHCCFVTCVRGSELFVIATRVLVEILDAVSDALLDEAWTTHSGGGDVAATCDLGCWDQRHHPNCDAFCGQHHAMLSGSLTTSERSRTASSSTQAVSAATVLCCPGSVIREASWFLHAGNGATSKLIISRFSVACLGLQLCKKTAMDRNERALHLYSPIKNDKPMSYNRCRSDVLQSVSYVGLDQAVTQRRDCPFLNQTAFPWGFCVLPRLSFSNRPANHR